MGWSYLRDTCIFLLYTWGPSIPIVHMGTIHPYCTHGDHPSLLYTWGPSIPIVHMGTIHPYCAHWDHPFQYYGWGIEHLYPWGNGGAFIAILSSPSLSKLPSPTTSSCQASGNDDICITTLIEAGANVNQADKVGICTLLLPQFSRLVYIHVHVCFSCTCIYTYNVHV